MNSHPEIINNIHKTHGILYLERRKIEEEIEGCKIGLESENFTPYKTINEKIR